MRKKGYISFQLSFPRRGHWVNTVSSPSHVCQTEVGTSLEPGTLSPYMHSIIPDFIVTRLAGEYGTIEAHTVGLQQWWRRGWLCCERQLYKSLRKRSSKHKLDVLGEGTSTLKTCFLLLELCVYVWVHAHGSVGAKEAWRGLKRSSNPPASGAGCDALRMLVPILRKKAWGKKSIISQKDI